PEEEQRPFLLLIGHRIFLAARESINGSVGEDKCELEFCNRSGKHVICDRCARFHFRENLSKELSVFRDIVDSSYHFSANRVVVARKSKASRFHTFCWRNEGLSDKQMCFVR